MPTDVFLVLASSGITLVASLLFFVSEEREPVQIEGIPVQFCLPPRRPRQLPPPLPSPPECAVDVSTSSLHSVMTLKPQGDEWVMILDMIPVCDTPAVRVEGEHGVGQVNDLRWNDRAGYVRPTQRQWKVKPGQA
ncbi:MAG: hypothetical protein JNJ54_34640 [Myxococcaceae bacterium]|nr:hypothetical protein [Myxococcaceae bacterium]